MSERKNILGEPLQPCCKFPMTGFMRDGYCRLYADDPGQHTVCFEASEEFLKFSAAAGNDLSTGIPEMDFPGLIPGDRWCLCALRWVEAYRAGAAPKILLSSTDESLLEYVPMEILQNFALDEKEFTV